MTKKTKKILLCALAALALLAAACWAYLADYYPAGEQAKALLSGDETVAVRAIDSGYLLDGPGQDAALIFYPGGKVECEAYLPLLHALAQAGTDCFLVRMPGNLALLGMNRAATLTREYAYAHWYLGGHSLGGVAAAMYASAHPEGIEGMVLLAAYSTKPLPDSLRALTLYGSEDGVLNRDKLAKCAQNLPADARMAVLPGGNHAQFGDYGPQKGDGAATVSPEEQLRWAVTEIQKMINGESL